MEVRDFALRVVLSVSLEEKLSPAPRDLTDERPGPPLRPAGPGRPQDLGIVAARLAKVPARKGMVDPAQRARILHALANHELQAAELYAWALLAFPGVDPAFRRGLLARVGEEQRHTELYRERLLALGARLGDFPVSGYFWGKVKDFTTPLRFICGMALTFENANLDHTLDYAESARAAGDRATAEILERVHQDEIEHVRFGWRWLGEWKESSQTMEEAYCRNVTWPLRPALARGKSFHPAGREAAGLGEAFIRLLSGSREVEEAERP